MTLLVASDLPTAVALWPVLDSWLTSGKKRLTTLNGTIAPRDNNAPDAATSSVADDRGCWPRTNGRMPSIATKNSASRFIGETATGLQFSRSLVHFHLRKMK